MAATRKFFARPLLGSVWVGQPRPATHEDPEVLTVDDDLIDGPNRTALIMVGGDSMKNIGLLDGVHHEGRVDRASALSA